MDSGFAFLALGRAGYGASPATLAELHASGYVAWLEAQVTVKPGAADPADAVVRAAQLRIRYSAGEGWSAADELRPLSALEAPVSTFWNRVDHKNPMSPQERRRSRDEVVAATVLRAVHSRWQVRETLCNFWHDHFNVDAGGSEAIAVALPTYDRDVVRKHCLGNFRELLEAVASSTAMQYYLSNRSSRAGSANENFARELFELHTLGRDAYLNDHYDRWREVPGALKGKPAGYIDQDVYEAARAFTGWTIEDGGSIDGRRKLSQTGQFIYVDAWHDGYQKRVLATEFDAFAPAQADGRHVLDLVAAHPATARFVCTKLARRYAGDFASADLVQRLAQIFNAHVESHDQIARVMRVLLSSKEFAASSGTKVRRPLTLAAAFARALEVDLQFSEPLAGELAAAGQNLFAWPTPVGLPDTAAPFLTSSAMRHRWTLLLGLAENTWGTGAIAGAAALGLSQPTTVMAVNALLTRLLGNAPASASTAIVSACGWPAEQPLNVNGAVEAEHRWNRLAAFCAMTPEFQLT